MSSKRSRADDEILEMFRRMAVEPVERSPDYLRYIVTQLRRDVHESSRIYHVGLSNGTGPLLRATNAELE